MGIREKNPTPHITAPVITENTGAMSARGHQMGAIRDGWYVLIENNKSRPHDGLIDELCVVQLVDGRNLVRFMKKGRKPDRWDLIPVVGDATVDAEVEWAERVEWIRPHKITDSELYFLETLDSHGYPATQI